MSSRSINLTSAVPGMSVSEMRKSLAEVRNFLSEQNSSNPFDMRRKLTSGVEVWNFVHLVAIGLHKKRSKNRKKDRCRVDSDSKESENE